MAIVKFPIFRPILRPTAEATKGARKPFVARGDLGPLTGTPAPLDVVRRIRQDVRRFADRETNPAALGERIAAYRAGLPRAHVDAIDRAVVASGLKGPRAQRMWYALAEVLTQRDEFLPPGVFPPHFRSSEGG